METMQSVLVQEDTQEIHLSVAIHFHQLEVEATVLEAIILEAIVLEDADHASLQGQVTREGFQV